MASRNKHRERSHRSYRKAVDAGVYGMFERKAAVRKVKVENKTIFQKIKEKLFKGQDNDKGKLFKRQDKGGR